MPRLRREGLSLPFVGLGLGILGFAVVDLLWYPALFTAEGTLTLTYGGLLAAFTLTYSYRPLRESRYGALVASLFVLVFAGLVYRQGMRGPLFPYGLFVVASTAFCYELYKLGTDRIGRGQAS